MFPLQRFAALQHRPLPIVWQRLELAERAQLVFRRLVGLRQLRYQLLFSRAQELDPPAAGSQLPLPLPRCWGYDVSCLRCAAGGLAGFLLEASISV